MFYAFSVLFFILGLVTGIPAFLQFIKLEKIRSNSSTTVGVIRSADVHSGLYVASEFGGGSRVLIAYQVNGTEHEVETPNSRSLMTRRFERGDTLEVVYSIENPGKAYLKREWNNHRIDLWKAAAEIILAAALWQTGLSLGMPL